MQRYKDDSNEAPGCAAAEANINRPAKSNTAIFIFRIFFKTIGRKQAVFVHYTNNPECLTNGWFAIGVA
jgi:hypothetical protein